MGRGCLAGPVVAAAVILPPSFVHPTLTDSKLLSKKQRRDLREEIVEKAISWAIATASAQEIDQLNILNASYLAMHRAVSRLHRTPALLLVDGNRFASFQDIPHECIVGGDAKFYSIAAASVLAKTYRDEYMQKLSVRYPEYQWDTNVGYPTRAHREGISKWGVTPHHRMSFRLRDT